MTIKKNSDIQISCTISASELANRQVLISELSYGSKKAKALINEIMKVAKDEFGFSSDNLPLVVEAIPLENDDITFIITKLEYPEELDARFSRFSKADESEYPPIENDEIQLDSSEPNIFEHLESIAQKMNEPSEEVDTNENGTKRKPKAPPFMIYSFDSMEDLISLANLLSPEHLLPSSVYKTGQGHGVHLLISPGSYGPDEFKSICEIISEYSSKDRRLKGSDLLLKEHYKPVIEENALEILAKL
ncbi:MAG: adaptor protein MecA [Lachnospiraceae bacterium]|nr:adaptor protein MecA [Lachnospiraceae bacterium]